MLGMSFLQSVERISPNVAGGSCARDSFRDAISTQAKESSTHMNIFTVIVNDLYTKRSQFSVYFVDGASN